MTLQVGDLIPIGGSGNVKKSEVLEGKTYSSDEGVELVGEMPNHGSLSKTITTQGGTQKISSGYYEGGEVKAQFNNLKPENIKRGVNIGGIMGSYESNVTFKAVDLPKDTFYLNNGENKTKFIPMDWGGVPVALSAGLIVGQYESDYEDGTYWTDYWTHPASYFQLSATKYYYLDGERVANTKVKITMDGIELSARTSSPAKYYGIMNGWVLILTNPQY